MKVAFDVDGTLIHAGWEFKGEAVPRTKVLDKIREHCANGDEIWIWSGGGKDYAESIARRIKLEEMQGIKIAGYLSKVMNDGSFDLAYDDEVVSLAEKNIQI